MSNIELKDLIAENSRQIAEVWAMFKATDKKIDRVSQTVDKLTGKWGRFVEYFLAPGIPQAFQEIGIAIHCTMQRLKKPEMEVDILGLNDTCLVVVEVKSTLDNSDINHFLKYLPKFRKIFPEFFCADKEKTVYGAVAGIEIHEKADRYAYQNGLFVLGQKGDTVKILNSSEFKAKTW